MIQRFQGIEGHRVLVQTLEGHRIVSGNSPVAEELASAGVLESFQPNNTLITQGAPDSDLFLILAGKVNVLVNGRKVAERCAGTHIGEMALIDPKARRSATIVASEETVVLRIAEPVFSSLATRFPALWRHLALELADRLRQREEDIRKPNEVPRLFIGSSQEGLPVARGLQSGLSRDSLLPRVWTDGAFGATSFAVDDLLSAVSTSDFAALVFAADDHVISRGAMIPAPRDNVIFELGLFMGQLGRRRTFLIKPRGADLKIPSDLLGIKPIEFLPGAPDTLPERIAPACNELREIIKRHGPR